MRKVEFNGWIVFDEEKNIFGEDIVSSISSALTSVEGARDWEVLEVKNEKVEE